MEAAQLAQGFNAIWTGIGAVVGSGGVLLVKAYIDKRKTKLKMDTQVIDLYERYAARTEERIIAMQSRTDNLIGQLDTLRNENSMLRIDNQQYKANNDILKGRVEFLESKINTIETSLKH